MVRLTIALYILLIIGALYVVFLQIQQGATKSAVAGIMIAGFCVWRLIGIVRDER